MYFFAKRKYVKFTYVFCVTLPKNCKFGDHNLQRLMRRSYKKKFFIESPTRASVDRAMVVFFHRTSRHSRRRIRVQLIITAETWAALAEVFRYPESFFLQVEFPEESFCTRSCSLSFLCSLRASTTIFLR